jgi:AsmA protein
MTEPNATPRRWPKILAAVLLFLVLLGVAAAFTLDRVLTSAARDQAARLAATWQRPVEIGVVKTTFLTGLGVRVEGVRIGAAAGEPRPLLELDRAEVKLELLRALRSGGKDVRVRSVELQGLRVVVVRLKDGSSNLQRLAETMAKGGTSEQPAATGPAQADEKPANLSMLRVEHASVLGARIAFLDEAAGGRELLVEQIDLTVDGLAAGAPLDLTLRAGLLSATQNLELKIHSPPLPPSLVPAPDRLTLKVAPVDLTPLAAFAPRGAGFQGGRFTADLDVVLGSAVPGGAGSTTVHGGFAATGLRFAGQEGGKALDVTLDADLAADTLKGDLAITRLLLAFGPAALEGKGKVTGLLSDHPTVEGLRIVSRNLDLAALAPYYPPLSKLLGGTVDGPIALSLVAAGTAARPVIELHADLTRVRIAIAKQVEKAAGGRLTFTARLRGGTGGTLGFDVEGDLAGLDLRPGGTLAKKPGDRFTLAAAGSRQVAGDVQTLEIGSVSMALLDMKLEGHGKLALAPKTTRFDLAVAVDRIDADKLLLQAPPAAAPPAAKAPAKPAATAAKVVTSPYAGLSGRCSLRVGEATVRKQKVADLRATVLVKEDEVTFEEGRMGIWAGTLSLAGTQAHLAPADRPFTLSARVEGVQVGSAIATWTDKKALTGRLDADVRLSGKGESADAIKRAIDGTVEGKLADGVFHGTDLIAEITGPLAKAVPALRQRAGGGGNTSLGKLVPFSLRIQGGQALLQKPLEIEQRDATMSVRGSFGLDGELGLPVTLALSPAAVAELSGGRAKLQSPLPFQFMLEGKAWKPRLAGLDVKPAAKVLVETLGVQALGKALGLGGAAPAGQPGDAQSQAVKDKAQDAKKKLEQDAKKALKGLLGR